MFYTASFVSLPETDTQGKAQRCHFHVPYRTRPRVAGIVGFTLWRIACIVAPGFRHPSERVIEVIMKISIRCRTLSQAIS